MANRQKELEWRTSRNERHIAGVQRQVNTLHALLDTKTKAMERRVRDLEIVTAVARGVPQKKVAEIFDLSASRVNQIYKKTG